MITDIILSAFVIAGAAMIWRQIVEDLPILDRFLRNRLFTLAGNALTCSFCTTFWFSLAWVIVFDPLSGWLPVARFKQVPFPIVFQIISSWMVVGVAALTVRAFTEQVFRLTRSIYRILKDRAVFLQQ